MRVALTVEQSWTPVPGGTAIATIELAGALASRPGLEVVGVAARHRHPAPPDWAVPIPTHHLGLPTLALFESWHKLRWPPVERATGRVDVVHGTILAVPPSRAPLVLTIHDLSFLANPEHFTRRGVRFSRRALDLALGEARLVTCPSLATARDCIAAGLPPDRVRVVPWGVRVNRASDLDVEATRHRYRLERPYLLFCGTVQPFKNLRRVVAAFRRVEESDLELVLVGPAGWKEDVRDELAALGGRGRSLGPVPRSDLGPLYAGAAAVVTPSLREGFCFPVLEAMAQGAPVVTSLGTATEEVAGDAALLVDPTDVGAIAAAISRILEDPVLAQRLRESGRSRAASYTWERTAEQMAGVYAEASGDAS